MKLNKLVLSDFRCFRDLTVDLSADVIAIYGRNGVGKTAIFDAIELALLGEIGRFNYTSEYLSFIPHVSGNGIAKIKLDLAGASDVSLNVLVDATDSPFISLEANGKAQSHSSLLYDLFVEEAFASPRRQVALVAELFRASVLLSQHSIRDFVEGDPSSRARMLASLSGSAYLQRCVDKVHEVLRVAESQLSSKLQSQSQAAEVFKAIETDYASAEGKLAEVRRDTRHLSATLPQLLEALRNAQIDGPSQSLYESNPEVYLASIKGIAEERLEAASQRHASIAALRNVFKDYLVKIEQSQQSSRKVEVTRQDILKTDAALEALEKDLVSKESQLNAVRVEHKQLKTKEQALRQVPELHREVVRLTGDNVSAATKRSQLHQQNEDLQREIVRLADRIKMETLSQNAIDRVVKPVESILKDLNTLRSRWSKYEKAAKQDREIGAALPVKSDGLDTALVKRKAILRSLREIRSDVRSLKKTIREFKGAAEEQTRLLEALAKQVKGKQCPLCGHVHRSQRTLRGEIRNSLKVIPEDIRKLLRSLQAKNRRLEKLNEQDSRQRRQIELLESEVTKLRKDRESAKKVIASMQSQLKPYRIPANKGALEAAISKRANAIEKQQRIRSATQGRIIEYEAELSGKRKTRDYLLTELEALQEEVKARTENISEHETQAQRVGINELSSKADSTAERLISELQGRLGQLAATERELGEFQSQSQKEISSAQVRRGHLEGLLKKAEAELSEVIASIEKFRFQAKALDLTGDVQRSHIQQLEEQSDNDRRIADRILQLVKGLEAENRKVRIENDVRQVALKLREATATGVREQEEILRLESSLKMLTSWAGPLSTSVDSIVDRVVESLAPDISRLFMSMIPPSGQFDSIALHRQGSSLEMGVRYRGVSKVSGEPKFFLSNAQANVLALAVFLSLAARQKWSRLDVQLLDDPVQHLDDLDAVSFLDNLRSLSLGAFGRRRQIVVSTCDQSLYLLLLRKFKMLKREGISFCGISLLDGGLDGPDLVYDYRSLPLDEKPLAS